MNIIKLALGRKVRIRVTIDPATGHTDARVVGNPNGEGCHKPTAAEESENERLLKDLMEAEVAGFGEMEITDSGLTEQGFAEKMKHRTKPLPFNPLKGPKAPIKPIEEEEEESKGRQLDTGFGV